MTVTLSELVVHTGSPMRLNAWKAMRKIDLSKSSIGGLLTICLRMPRRLAKIFLVMGNIVSFAPPNMFTSLQYFPNKERVCWILQHKQFVHITDS